MNRKEFDATLYQATYGVATKDEALSGVAMLIATLLFDLTSHMGRVADELARIREEVEMNR